MNKVINYISYQSFPAETANSLQTISNLKYLKKNDYEIRLFFPLREKNSSDDLKTIQKYYLLNQEIDVKGIKHPYPFGKLEIGSISCCTGVLRKLVHRTSAAQDTRIFHL